MSRTEGGDPAGLGQENRNNVEGKPVPVEISKREAEKRVVASGFRT